VGAAATNGCGVDESRAPPAKRRAVEGSNGQVMAIPVEQLETCPQLALGGSPISTHAPEQQQSSDGQKPVGPSVTSTACSSVGQGQDARELDKDCQQAEANGHTQTDGDVAGQALESKMQDNCFKMFLKISEGKKNGRGPRL
jgi:hypothetical protein